MIKQNQRILNVINLVSDAGLTCLSYFLAISFRFDLLDGSWSVDLHSVHMLRLVIVYCLVQVVVFYMMRVYVPQRYNRAGREILAIITGNAVCMLALVAWLYVLRMGDVARIMLAAFYVISSGLIILKHLLVRKVLVYFRKAGFNLKHVILIGSGYQAHQYAENIRMNPQMGFHLEGYIGTESDDRLGHYLGDFTQMREALKRCSDLDELIIALSLNEENWMRPAIDAANWIGIRAKVIPQYNDYIPANPSIDVVGSTKLINLSASPLDNVINAIFKRTMDILLSAIGLVLVSPVLLIVAIGVKLSSPGPVFFVQERVGRNKKPFKMLKFRSMRVNDVENTAWSTNSDPRKTPFGSFIRKTSLDELPQLFNVLIGDMSLVGPRPEIPFHVEHFQNEIPGYLVRQQVRPGITGWAQINGYRGDTDIAKRIELDLWYIHNWCVRLDIEILWRTVTGGFLNQETLCTNDESKNHS